MAIKAGEIVEAPSFAQRLREWRRRLGLSGSAAIEALGGKPTLDTLRSWEQGRRKPENVARVLMAMEVVERRIRVERWRSADGLSSPPPSPLRPAGAGGTGDLPAPVGRGDSEEAAGG